MRTKMLKNYIAFIGILSSPLFANANDGVGTTGGGQGVITPEGQLVLRDLAERTNCTWVQSKDFIKSIPTYDAITGKLKDIQGYFVVNVDQKVQGLNICMTESDLVQLPAIDADSVTTYTDENNVQIAIRLLDQPKVFISMPHFRALDGDNQTYLMYHEAMHDYLPITTARRNQSLRSQVAMIKKAVEGQLPNANLALYYNLEMNGFEFFNKKGSFLITGEDYNNFRKIYKNASKNEPLITKAFREEQPELLKDLVIATGLLDGVEFINGDVQNKLCIKQVINSDENHVDVRHYLLCIATKDPSMLLDIVNDPKFSLKLKATLVGDIVSTTMMDQTMKLEILTVLVNQSDYADYFTTLYPYCFYYSDPKSAVNSFINLVVANNSGYHDFDSILKILILKGMALNSDDLKNYYNYRYGGKAGRLTINEVAIEDPLFPLLVKAFAQEIKNMMWADMTESVLKNEKFATAMKLLVADGTIPVTITNKFITDYSKLVRANIEQGISLFDQLDSILLSQVGRYDKAQLSGLRKSFKGLHLFLDKDANEKRKQIIQKLESYLQRP